MSFTRPIAIAADPMRAKTGDRIAAVIIPSRVTNKEEAKGPIKNAAAIRIAPQIRSGTPSQGLGGGDETRPLSRIKCSRQSRLNSSVIRMTGNHYDDDTGIAC
jgi:hypothetical protein